MASVWRLPVSLIRRSVHLKSAAVRNESIFTKYREPPNGFLFNEKPRKPGEKRQWEAWEAPTYIGFGLSFLILFLGYHYKPNAGVKTWARHEALLRIAELEAEEAAAAAERSGESAED